ncbi:MAG: cytochrome c biogenesis protein CcsA [Thermodesulfobacteriota bacterium]
MEGLEKILYFASLSLYAASALAAFSGFLTVRRYRVFYVLAIALFGVLIGVRWYYAGHPPIFGTYEKTLSASFTVALFSLIFDREGRFARFTATFAFATLLYGSLFDSGRKPLVISEQSLWVDFHVLFAWIAYGFYTLVFAAAIGILIKKEVTPFSKGGLGGIKEETVDAASDWLMRKGLLYGFIGQTVFFVIGSYYSARLHGRWWMWDTVEYLFVASWLMYAAALHGRILSGWSNKRTAAWVAAGFATAMVLYWGLIYFPHATYHIFDIEIKTHFP